jgi:hypothetical protein
MTIMKDGFSTTISFSAGGSGAMGITILEKTVTPPGMDGGDAIEVTTMRNTNWRTKWPKSLKDLTDCSFSAAYDSAAYDDLLFMLLVNQEITITFPDESTLAFWGYLKSFIPGENAEGVEPIAQCVIVPTNLNNSDVEQDPDYTA